MSWSNFGSLHFDSTITIAAMVGSVSTMFAFIGCLIAVGAYRRSYPRLTIQPFLEAYDTRESQNGRVAWYWTIRIINDGGRAFALLGLRKDELKLPMAVLAKDWRLLEDRAAYALYVTDVPRFEDVQMGADERG
jgi:hypothetical protein